MLTGSTALAGCTAKAAAAANPAVARMRAERVNTSRIVSSPKFIVARACNAFLLRHAHTPLSTTDGGTSKSAVLDQTLVESSCVRADKGYNTSSISNGSLTLAPGFTSPRLLKVFFVDFEFGDLCNKSTFDLNFKIEQNIYL